MNSQNENIKMSSRKPVSLEKRFNTRPDKKMKMNNRDTGIDEWINKLVNGRLVGLLANVPEVMSDCLKFDIFYRGASPQTTLAYITAVSSPACHTLWAKDSLEQLLQILGPSVKCLFHSKRMFVVMNIL